MIAIEYLTKKFGDKIAVSEACFTAEPGKVTGLLGPNGAGKTTTMRVLLGLETPTSGRATICGKRYRSIRYPLRTVGAQLDGAGAHKGRTAKAHLMWLARSNAIPVPRIAEVLEIVGLTSVAGNRVGSFSFGMKQRLGIASALIGDPKVIILDEPANGLDAEGIVWLRGVLRSLASDGRTVLVSSHLMSEMQATADNIVVIAKGTVVKQGALDTLISQHENLEDAYFQWVKERSEYATHDAFKSNLGGQS